MSTDGPPIKRSLEIDGVEFSARALAAPNPTRRRLTCGAQWQPRKVLPTWRRTQRTRPLPTYPLYLCRD